MSAVHVRLRTENDGQRVLRTQLRRERAGVQIISAVVEAAGTLHGEIKVTVPLVRGLCGGRRAQQIEGCGAVERYHPQAVLDRLDLHRRSVPLGASMSVAIVDQHLNPELQVAAGARELVADVRGARAVAHPDALLEQRVGKSKRPHGHRAFEPEPLDMQVTARVDSAVRPAVGVERKSQSVVLGGLFELCDQERAAKRRLERRHQKSMVATCERSGHCAGGETTESVGGQPLALFGGIEVTTNLAAEINVGFKHGKQRSVVGCRLPVVGSQLSVLSHQ